MGIIAATTGRFYEWVSVFLEKRPREVFRSTLSLVAIPKWSHNGKGGSRAAATSKMERFAIIVNGFQPLTIITKRSILDATAALDPPLNDFLCSYSSKLWQSVSWYNLDKELNRIKEFLKKETIFLTLDTTQIPVKNLCRTDWTSDGKIFDKFYLFLYEFTIFFGYEGYIF